MMVERPRDLIVKKVLAHGFMIFFLVLILVPFAMVVSISLREGNFSIGEILPTNPTLEHWYLAFGQTYTRADGTVVKPPYPVLLWMFNSVKIGLIASIFTLAISTISGYAFARIRFKGRAVLLDSLFLIQMFPTTLALVAIFAIFDSLGEISPLIGIDSHWSVILVYLSAITLHIWTIKGYFDNLDPALDKAPRSTARHPGRPSATSSCRWRCRSWRSSSFCPSSTSSTIIPSPRC